MTQTILMLVTIAALANGLLTGGNVDRLLVATPAWEEAGLNAWADFSRAADLGHGQIFYPLLALGSIVLAVVAAVIFVWKHRTPSGALAAVGLSAAFMIVALRFSLKAVPFMQSLRSIHDGDTAALGQAFAGAHFWGRFQGYAELRSPQRQGRRILRVAGSPWLSGERLRQSRVQQLHDPIGA